MLKKIIKERADMMWEALSNKKYYVLVNFYRKEMRRSLFLSVVNLLFYTYNIIHETYWFVLAHAILMCLMYYTFRKEYNNYKHFSALDNLQSQENKVQTVDEHFKEIGVIR